MILNFTVYSQLTEAFDLRLKDEKLPGGFQTGNLFYHSISWLCKDQFGAARLLRDVADGWVAEKFQHCGQKFSREEPVLSQAEINNIPGAAAHLGGLDSIQFTMLERVQDRMMIKNDEHIYWTSQLGQYADDYQKLWDHHLDIIGGDSASASEPAATPAGASEASEVPNQPSENANGSQAFETVESVEKLTEQCGGLAHRTASEVSGVEILMMKDESFWLVAPTGNKTVPRHSQIGGFGTGQYLPTANEEPGLEFNLTDDSAVVQLDMSTFRTDGSGISTMSLYKMLLLAEQEKNITSLSVSWLKVTRKADAAVEAGTDGFEISIKQAMKFCKAKDPRTAAEDSRVNCKNIFGQKMNAVTSSKIVAKCFRFRFERVGGTFKVQKPYLICTTGVCLEKGKPLKISA